jgi:hypothetical protein
MLSHHSHDALPVQLHLTTAESQTVSARTLTCVALTDQQSIAMRVNVRVRIDFLLKVLLAICCFILCSSLCVHLVVSWVAMACACMDWSKLQRCLTEHADDAGAVAGAEDGLISCAKQASYAHLVTTDSMAVGMPEQMSLLSWLEYSIVSRREHEASGKLPVAAAQDHTAQGGVSQRDSLEQVMRAMQSTKLSLLAVCVTGAALALLRVLNVRATSACIAE